MSRQRWPLAAVAIAAVIGAGCSDGSAETGSNGSGGGTSTTASKTVRLADCMRDNGVRDFPDSNTDSDQEFVEAIDKAREKSGAAWDKALTACKDLAPPGLLGRKATPEETDKRLAFAQCMRDNGIKDFPDPEADGPLIDTNRIPSARGRGALEIPGFTAATEACGDAAAAALGEQ